MSNSKSIVMEIHISSSPIYPRKLINLSYTAPPKYGDLKYFLYCGSG